MRESDQNTLREMLHRTARWFPHNEAAVEEATRLTYKQLLESAQQCAAIYYELGVRKGDRVVLMSFPSTVHCIALFAAVELGALPVALHIRESLETLSAIVNRVSPRIIVYDAALEEKIPKLLESCHIVTGTVRTTSSVPAQLHPDAKPSAEIPADLKHYTMDFEPMPVYEHEMAAIVFTSGTTGVPKGIVHTNRTLMESARAIDYLYYCILPSDSIINMFTTSFIGWYNASIPLFSVGAKCVFRPKFDPKAYLEIIQDEKITIAILVPTMWRMIFAQGADTGKYDLSSVKVALFAGEVMDPITLKRIQDNITPQVMNGYGTTETGSGSGCTLMLAGEMIGKRLKSVGKPSLNADLRIIKPGGTRHDQVPAGETGEIIVRGPSVASLVWDDPKTARKIFEFDGSNTWWHSGDMGYLDEDHYLYLEGRTDDMIISGGINIMPPRIEEVLLSHPDVAEVAVVGFPDPQWGQRVKAFVVSKNPNLTAEALDKFMKKSELANYQRPRLYEFVDTLPRTFTGKIDRKALRQQKS